MLLNWVKLRKEGDIAATDRKRHFPPQANPLPCHCSHRPLWGNHQRGREKRCCFLFTQAPLSLPPPSTCAFLSPSRSTIIICPSAVIKLFPLPPPSSSSLFSFFLSFLRPLLCLSSPVSFPFVFSLPPLNHSLIIPSIFLIIPYPPIPASPLLLHRVAGRTPTGRYWSA